MGKGPTSGDPLTKRWIQENGCFVVCSRKEKPGFSEGAGEGKNEKEKEPAVDAEVLKIKKKKGS